MAPISSSQNPLIKLLRSLDQKKARRETGLFCAAGHKVLLRARQLGWTPDHLLYREDDPPLDLANWAKPELVTGRLMEALSGQSNPPTAFAAFQQRWAPLPKAHGRAGLWIALEAIRDPGNLGTIIRTAEAAGAAGIILAGDCCDPWGQDCVRATVGSIFAVPLARATEAELLGLAAAWGGEVIGTAMVAVADYRRPYPEDTLLLMGSEGTGLSPALLAACHHRVRIPMAPGPESLNVAIATALMAFEIRKAALT